jgi:hypothetical protein
MDAVPRGSRAKAWVWMVLAIGVPAALYLSTLYPGPGGRINVGDSAKFQYIGEILGVPHEPGYPQYVVLNFLWTRLPLPLPLADKVNLLSAVLSLIAGGFLFSALWRLTARPGIALLGTWTVLLARSVWIFSTEAEVYSLHLVWVTALLWAITHLLQEEASRRFRWLIVAVLILGFSFGNHPTAILLIPGFLAAVLALDYRLALSLRVLATTSLIAVLALGQYGFVLWRSHSDAPFLEGIGRDASVSDLIGKVSGARFSTKHVLKEDSQGMGRRFLAALLEFPRQLSWPTLILAGIGTWTLLGTSRLLGLYLFLGVLGPPVFVSFYQIGDWQAYLAPAFVSLATLAAMGTTWHGLSTPKWQRLAIASWLLGIVWVATAAYPRIRVEENPRDRSALLAAAAPGDWVVTYPVNGYSFRQLNFYYRYGLGLEERKGIRIRTAPEIFEQEWAFLGDDRMIFATQAVRDVFDEYRTEYVPLWSGASEDLALAATGARFPVHALQLLPDQAGGVRVMGPDGLVLATPDKAIQIIIVSPSQRRIKGVASFPSRRAPTRHSRWPLRDFLHRIRNHDWVCVILQGPALARGDEGVRLILDTFAVPVSARSTSATSLVITGLKGSSAEDLLVLGNPSEPADLPLPGDS